MRGNVVRRVAVQQRRRLFREGLAQLLDAESDLELVGAVETGHELVRLCPRARPDAVVLEADMADWDPCPLAARLTSGAPSVRVIAFHSLQLGSADAAALRAAGVHLLRPADGVIPVLGALRATVPMRQPPGSSTPRRDSRCLTGREVAILVLVGGGCTSREISGRLQISPSTVENHKQRIFTKLGVQNQAHAVSVAMSHGIVTSDALADYVTAGQP